MFDPALNAVPVRDFARARAHAARLDRTRHRLETLPALFGVPMTVKESFNIAGLPTSWGVRANRNNIADEDAFAVAGFKRAGAVILGKTNVSEQLADWQSSNPVYGTTNNPWDITRTPGGSSGGAAAALAAGLTPLEAGSDSGGSLRAPAHYCGIYAHKTTWSISPLRGHSIGPGIAPYDIGVIGPMARAPADLVLGLEAMSGPEKIITGWSLKLPRPEFKSLRSLRIAILPDHEICPVEAQISDSFHQLAKHLRKQGAKVSLTARPNFDAREAYENYLLLLSAVISGRMPDERHEALRQRVANTPASNRDLALISARGAVISHRDWLRASEYRFQTRLAWGAFFENYDVLITPVAATAAVTHDLSDDMSTRTITVDDAEITVADQLFWAAYASNFLLPSTAAPLGFTPSGLPFGMQIIGAPYADYSTIAVAALLEKSWLGFQPPPGYGA